MTIITGYKTHDVRFPTNVEGDGTDAMNTECDYSSAYVVLSTSDPGLTGYGQTFTIGRGNNIVCLAIQEIAEQVKGKDIETLFSNMGKTWDDLVGDPQLRWIGPEKGVIALATAAVDNAIWDLYAKSRKKPLWKLIVDMSPEEIVKSTTFRYITDALTPQEALAMLKAKADSKGEREKIVREKGYPAYVTSAGWLRYDDEKVARLTQEAIARGFTHFKMKVGTSLESDLRRARLVRSIIDDPRNFPAGYTPPEPARLVGKNAGPMGTVLMFDANQVELGNLQNRVNSHLDKGLGCPRSNRLHYENEGHKTLVIKSDGFFSFWKLMLIWNTYTRFIEEPTAPDDVHGHAAIRKALKPHGVGVATGEHAHNRIVFKQLLQAEAIDVCQIDSCRLSGVTEVLSVLLMAAKFGIPVCPHAGGIGLCQYTIHLSLIDYVAISGSIDRNVLEFADHLHENFTHPVSLNAQGRYNVPNDPNEGYSIELHQESIKTYEWPHGSYWASL